jgi:hypothetical protein
MLRHFENQAVAVVGGSSAFRSPAGDRRTDVDDGADDLATRARLAGHALAGGLGRLLFGRSGFSPLLAMTLSIVLTSFSRCLERFRARNDFDQFLGDLA